MHFPRTAPLIAVILGAFLSPTAALAQVVTSNNLEDIIAILFGLLNFAIPIMFAFALLGFLWGIMLFIWNAGNEKKKREGRSVIIWGVVAMFALVSITGIIALLQNTFGLSGNASTPLQVPSANPCTYAVSPGGNCFTSPIPASDVNQLPSLTPRIPGIPGSHSTLGQ